MRRWRVLCGVLLIAALALTACGGSGAGGGGTTGGQAEPQQGGGGDPAPAQQPGQAITLSIGGPHAPEGAPWVQLLRDYFIPEVKRRVEEETPHTIDFTEAWAGSVAGIDEVSEAVQTRILDMGYITAPSEQGRLPMHVFNYWVPFGPGDPMVVYEATRRLWDEFPVLAEYLEENYNQKFLGFTVIQNYGLVSNFPVNSLGDINGRKIGGIGPNLDYVRYAGGVGVTAGIPDMYPSIQTGLFDAMIILPQSIIGTKMWEVAPYWIATDFGSLSPHILTINLDAWHGLPEEVQAIIAEAGAEWSRRTAEDSAASQEANLQAWQDNGGQVIGLDDEERRAWAALFPDTYVTDAAAQCDAQGLPCTELVGAYLEFLQDAGYQLPRQWLPGN